ncbi:MAG: hypothetical protein DI629_18195 [Mesorhizobium amorphae]|nr:MAG: hypothetical protein DI629_18195 [Mesorhizobium amorphae]
MAVEWTRHRFSGGALALDLANTVVLRNKPADRFDRLEDAAELPRFSAAARLMRVDEFGTAGFAPWREGEDQKPVIALREAVDAFFRKTAGGADGLDGLPHLLRAIASVIEETKAGSFGRALGLSALSLLEPGRGSRIRICPNCAWLFLDASRNGSRVWCDMAVCGNRQKARRHFLRHKAERVDG